MGDLFALYGARWEFFSRLIGQHIRISLTAIGIAAVLGLLLGIWISRRRRLAAVVLSVVNVVYTIPSISLLGFLIPVTGIGDKTAIIALTVYGLLPMVRNTCTGLNALPPAVLEVADAMGSTPWQSLTRVRLPMALPVILAGFRSMVVMTVSLSGVSAFIGAGGLGVAVYRGITTNNALMTVAGSLLIAAVALLADLLIGFGERRLRRKWRL